MKKITRFKGGEVVLDLDKLSVMRSSLMAAMSTDVGVLGHKAGRVEAGKLTKAGGHKKSDKASDLTNADIGLLHEKGSLSQHIPRRSFLLMPLEQESFDLNNTRKALWHAFVTGKTTLREAYKQLGIAAEIVIQKAFETGGFGRWRALADSTKARKHSSAILIDTAQLRKSIDSRVVSK